MASPCTTADVVNAAPVGQQERIRLELRSTREFPRRLRIEHEPRFRYSGWSVAMYTPHRRGTTRQLAYVFAGCEEPVRLSYGSDGRQILWLGSASFEVSADEARSIRETFESHGLTVEHAAPRAPATEQALGAPTS